MRAWGWCCGGVNRILMCVWVGLWVFLSNHHVFAGLMAAEGGLSLQRSLRGSSTSFSETLTVSGSVIIAVVVC